MDDYKRKFPFFYKSVSYERVGDFSVLHKTYGPLHTVFYVMLVTYFLISIITILYSFFFKSNVSKKIVILLFVPGMTTFLSFFIGRLFTNLIDFSVFSYVFLQAFYLLIVYEICLYDVNDTHIDSLVKSGTSGFISFDFSMKYLGSNDAAKAFIPELNDIHVDTPITKNEFLKSTMYDWLEDFKNGGKKENKEMN